MDYFNKNKILGWLIIIGLAINIAAISTILYKVYYQKEKNECNKPIHKNPHELLRNELNLSPEQEQKFKEIRESTKEEAKTIFTKMREQRTALYAVLTQKNPDTLKINQYISEIEKSQSLLLHHGIKHYLQLKNVLREDQYQKLNLLFTDMFGCDKGPGCKKPENENSCGEKNNGKGGNRHRHGQENKECDKGF